MIYSVNATNGFEYGFFEASSVEEAILEATKAAGYDTLDAGAKALGTYDVDQYIERFDVVPAEGRKGVSVFEGIYGRSGFDEIKGFDTREEAEEWLRSEGIEPSLCGRHWSGTGTYVLGHGQTDRPIYKIA